ncbi:MAG: thiamine-phosphate kinase [Proteobacteria bacterium]|nr:MAG: thiamine-phosphate kinase [Pseudomonadota bacterium]
MDEFELVDRYFRPLGSVAAGIVLGIGDDCAILDAPSDEQLVVTTDTHVESVHFPAGADAREIAYRSCVTSLSDVAAMGASARWASLAMTLPRAADSWLEAFARGVAEALQQCGAVLIGGDTTAGPLVITWHIIGTVAAGAALRRGGAQVGDLVYVSGTLGDAAGALELGLIDGGSYNKFQQELRARYWSPQPPFELARKLCGVATSCIDISDGLIADLAHIAESSDCGAEVEFSKIPIAPALLQLAGLERARRLAATGGDDYELCFTIPPSCESALLGLAGDAGLSVTQIGRMTSGAGVRVIADSGATVDLGQVGYRHFE